jgi:hypothetical protein
MKNMLIQNGAVLTTDDAGTIHTPGCGWVEAIRERVSAAAARLWRA